MNLRILQRVAGHPAVRPVRAVGLFALTRWRQFALLITFMGMVMGAMAWQTIGVRHLSNDIPQKAALLADAERSVTTAHLWAEEMLAGDIVYTIAEVRGELHKARMALDDVMMVHYETPLMSVDDGPPPSAHLVEALDALNTMEALMVLRFNSVSEHSPNSQLDSQIDKTHWTIKHEIDTLQQRLLLVAKNEVATFENLSVFLLVLLGVSCLVSLGVYYRIEQIRDQAWRALQEANQEIEINNQRLSDLAHRDTLTGLPNRTHLMEHLSQTMIEHRRSGHAFGLMLLDLDGFKEINDTLGHDIGDQILELVASRLVESVPGETYVARPGGDEFIVLVSAEDISNAIMLTRTTAAALLSSFAKPISFKELRLTIAASIGMAVFPVDARDRRSLIKYADLAMYNAKTSGRNRAVMYSSTMGEAFETRARLTQDLRHALQRQEFYLLYQPIVRLTDGKPIGVESLLRWHHAELGMISPADFIPLAEETGHIVEIGAWVMEEAVRQMKLWREHDHHPEQVNINLSPIQLAEDDVVGRLTSLMVEHDLEDCSFFEFEITETALMADKERAKRTLSDLRGLGARIAIDDFGTGYASLAYLSDFEFDVLKLDQTIVNKALSVGRERTILLAMIQMAENLGVEIVAEGIETEALREIMREVGCHFGQGYLFSRPVPPLQALAHFRVAERRITEGRRTLVYS